MDFFTDNSFRERKCMEGIIIFSPGDDAKEAYRIEEGEIAIYKEGYDKNHTVAELGKGDIFGEMSAVKYKKHSLFAAATTDVVLTVIPAEALRDKLENADPFVRDMVQMYIKRLYASNELIQDSKEDQRRRKTRMKRLSGS
jgi:ATP-binding cassette subfamily B protein